MLGWRVPHIGGRRLCPWEIYDDLRDRKEGRIVGRLADGVCGSCHLRLSAAEVSRVVRDDPPRCIHCRSILVV